MGSQLGVVCVRTNRDASVDHLQSKQAAVVVHLITTERPLSLHNGACLYWIAQQAMGFSDVHIKIRASLPAQLLPHLATALKAAAALAPSGWQLQLDAGEKTQTVKLYLSKAVDTASPQVLIKLVKCPNDSHSIMSCRIRHHGISIWLSTACRGAERLASKHSLCAATFLF